MDDPFNKRWDLGQGGLGENITATYKYTFGFDTTITLGGSIKLTCGVYDIKVDATFIGAKASLNFVSISADYARYKYKKDFGDVVEQYEEDQEVTNKLNYSSKTVGKTNQTYQSQVENTYYGPVINNYLLKTSLPPPAPAAAVVAAPHGEQGWGEKMVGMLEKLFPTTATLLKTSKVIADAKLGVLAAQNGIEQAASANGSIYFQEKFEGNASSTYERDYRSQTNGAYTSNVMGAYVQRGLILTFGSTAASAPAANNGPQYPATTDFTVNSAAATFNSPSFSVLAGATGSLIMSPAQASLQIGGNGISVSNAVTSLLGTVNLGDVPIPNADAIQAMAAAAAQQARLAADEALAQAQAASAAAASAARTAQEAMAKAKNASWFSS